MQPQTGLRFVAFQIAGPAESDLSTAVVNTLVNATGKYRDSSVVVDHRAFRATQRNAVLKAATEDRAGVAIWGGVLENGSQIVNLHFNVLNPKAALPSIKEVHSYALPGESAAMARDIGLLSIVTIGLDSYERRHYDDAITAFSDFLAQARGQLNLPLDPAIVYFYRGLAQQGWSETADRNGNPQGVIRRLETAISDFDTVLQTHPGHCGTFWNRGLAHQTIGYLLNSHRAFDESVKPYSQAAADFVLALSPSLPEPDFLVQQPNHADVIWNLALTNSDIGDALMSTGRFATAVGYLTAALDRFDELVDRESSYRDFMKVNAARVYFKRGYVYAARAHAFFNMNHRAEGAADLRRATVELQKALSGSPAPELRTRIEAALRVVSSRLTNASAGSAGDPRAF